jgi:putative AlgH/UPF0301 family transcriptional regulator
MWSFLFIVFLFSVPTASFFCPSSKSLSRRKLKETRLFGSLDSVRFLGRGKHAIVRPGVVLLSPPEEFQHFLRRAAVFVYAMGEDDDGVFVIRGAIIDHPTAFTMGEMADQDGDAHEVFQNRIFRGGEFGSESAFMFHSDETLGELTENEMIGTSGIFQGGLEYAIANNKSLDPEKAKFFFNYMEFDENELESMLDSQTDANDAWISVEVPPEMVLNSDYDRGEAWARLRNAVKER